MSKTENYGAPVERGIVDKITEAGYIVSSITRDGIKSLPIKSMIESSTYEVGDKVYFCLFPDGDGLIFAKK